MAHPLQWAAAGAQGGAVEQLRAIVALDLEFDAYLPREWDAARPPRATCAAVARLVLGGGGGGGGGGGSADDGAARTATQLMDAPAAVRAYADRVSKSQPARYTPTMSAATCRRLVDRLEAAAAEPHTLLVTWGGTHGDWRVLAAQCGDAAYAAKCARLALGHVDLALLVATACGGRKVKLASAARGFGVGDKDSDTSACAHDLWGSGLAWLQRGVLRHVRMDAALTALVAAATLRNGGVLLSRPALRAAAPSPPREAAPSAAGDVAERTYALPVGLPLRSVQQLVLGTVLRPRRPPPRGAATAAAADPPLDAGTLAAWTLAAALAPLNFGACTTNAPHGRPAASVGRAGRG